MSCSKVAVPKTDPETVVEGYKSLMGMADHENGSGCGDFRGFSKLDPEDPLQEVSSQQAHDQERPDPMHRGSKQAEIPSRVSNLDGQKVPIWGKSLARGIPEYIRRPLWHVFRRYRDELLGYENPEGDRVVRCLQ